MEEGDRARKKGGKRGMTFSPVKRTSPVRAEKEEGRGKEAGHTRRTCGKLSEEAKVT